jgi:hypothetical protein
VVPPVHAGVQVASAQVPAWQVWPVGHARPQAPQWLGFEPVSTQPPVQQLEVPVQVPPAPQRHAPPVQVSPGSHAGVHRLPQVPSTQVVPTAQLLPQVPQWLALRSVSTHAPPQHV